MRLKIGAKIVIAVVVLAILVIGIISRFSFNFYREAIIDQMIVTGQLFASTIKKSSRYDMLANRYDSVKKIISAVGRQEGVARVRLLSKDGRIFYSSNEEEEGRLLTMKNLECSICHNANSKQVPAMEQRVQVYTGADDVMYLAIFDPIVNEESCWTADCHYHSRDTNILGVLDVAIPLSHMEEQIWVGKVRTITFAGVAITLFVVITLLVVRRLVLEPVTMLVDATGRVAQGEWTDPIPGGRQDEMGELIRSFNRMQEKLQFSQRQLVLTGRLASVGKLAAGVAHEINNPLTGILTFAEDLLDESSEGDPRREDYEVIKRETLRCRQIVRNLLDFARQDKPEVSSVDINEVIKRTITLVQRLAQFQNCAIELNLQSELPMVRGDSSQLQQVYLNLLINATEAMPQGGEIRITTRHTPGSPLIDTIVKDTGQGMDDAERQRIFEPFFSTKQKKRGQGLGLSVTWGIIEQHGGTIDVTSKPGEGAAFTVRLPAILGKRKPT